MKKGVLLLIFLAMLIPLASAEIFVSQPKGMYNIGDSFSFNVTVIPAVNINNFFVAKVSCIQEEVENLSNMKEVEIFRTPLSLKSGTQKTVEVSGRFDNFLIGDLHGTCNLNVVYGNQAASTPDFEITRNIYVNIATDKVILEPNERFNISGRAMRSNGAPVNGFVELKIPDLEITSFRAIEGGRFDIMLAIPENTPAKDYTVSARVYEKDDEGEITNEGAGESNIRVKQVIRKNEISISSQRIKPREELVYTALLKDQSDENVAENVKVSFYKPDGALLVSKLVKSGEANNITLEGSSTPGYWRISSTINNLQANRSFYVEEFESISFRLTNGTLSVTNTGNVPYKKSLEVLIGDTPKVQEVDIGVGETRRYVLSAPDGEYEIGVDSGNGREVVGTSFLTGNAVRIDSEGSGLFGKSSWLIWMVLIGACALIAIQQYGKISKRAYYGKTPSASQTATYSAPINLAGSSDKKAGVITEGVREECSVISLKIKNHAEIEKTQGNAMDALERSLTRARDARAKIFSDKEYKTIILAPSLTKEKDNSMKAVAVAREIENILTEHNKRFAEKIMFGIGVHNGEMIVESANGQFKVNSIGNTIPYAKKIADSASSGTGVSEHVHRRVLGKVKSDRIEGTNYWRVFKVRDSGLHSEFINRFVERQRKEGMFKK